MSEEGITHWSPTFGSLLGEFEIDSFLDRSNPSNGDQSLDMEQTIDFLNDPPTSPLSCLTPPSPSPVDEKKALLSKTCFKEKCWDSVPDSPQSPSNLEDWEEELSSAVEMDDGFVPSLDPKKIEELVAMPVKNFNIQTKGLKLDENTMKFLKLSRKRRKNREAAIRSRQRKENQVVSLVKQVETLQSENERQRKLIAELNARLATLESSKKK